MNQYKQYLYYQVQAPNRNDSLSLIFWFSHNGPLAINDSLEILYGKVKGKKLTSKEAI